MGRGPLDEEAIRTIEAGNPDLEFDWTRILKGQTEAALEERDGGGRAERRDPDRRERRAGSRGRERRLESKREEPGFSKVDLEPETPRTAPSELAGLEPTTAAHAKLGSEGLARLRARYSETLARIDERVAQPDRQEQLKALAERLNPDGWVTDSDVAAGLESYEATFAELRSAIPSTRGLRPSFGARPERDDAGDRPAQPFDGADSQDKDDEKPSL